MDEKQKSQIDFISNLIKNLSILIIIGVVAYKIITSPFQIEMDVVTLISLLLALFSIYLSALFYFKATETSNSFYDNTYKFTKDIAELLVRIESGFGERLRHLDESYSKIQDKFDRYTRPDEIEQTQKEAEESQKDLEEKVKQREEIIEDLANRAKLQGKERDSILKRLAEAENELSNSRRELDFFQSELARVKSTSDNESLSSKTLRQVTDYTQNKVVRDMDPSFIASAPATLIKRRWAKELVDLDNLYVKDLMKLRFVDNNQQLTANGIRFFKEQARHVLKIDDKE